MFKTCTLTLNCMQATASISVMDYTWQINHADFEILLAHNNENNDVLRDAVHRLNQSILCLPFLVAGKMTTLEANTDKTKYTYTHVS